MTANCGVIASEAKQSRSGRTRTSSLGLRPEPVDDLAAGRLPDAVLGGDVAEHLVEVPNAPRLAHDPRMQMYDHQPPGCRPVGVEAVEPLAPQQVDFADGAPAVEVDVVVVE